MKREEIEKIYDEICKIINGIYTYHTDYWVGPSEWNTDESYLCFTVHGYSDQGMGAEWEEYWGINREGKIYDPETIYNSLEEFKNNW